MEVSKLRIPKPFFSICIPQYNRTSFLIEVCKSLMEQTDCDFEVCISDDCSTDGREKELIDFLENSGIAFVYQRQAKNLRYDGNLRASIALARGKYAFLLGNDDALATPTTLAELQSELKSLGEIGVTFTNYVDYVTGAAYPRVFKTEIVGSGPAVAAQHFRNFSFVSGVILNTRLAQGLTTSAVDGSEMYQMYIGCRMIAAGAALATINQVTIRKDIQLAGEQVDSYATKRQRNNGWRITPRHLTLGKLGPLVVDAIEPYVHSHERQPLFENIYLQLYLFTYPFWLFEYRRVQSWHYALCVCLGLHPRYTLADINFSVLRRSKLLLVYTLTSCVGLTFTQSLFQAVRTTLHRYAKQVNGRFARAQVIP